MKAGGSSAAAAPSTALVLGPTALSFCPMNPPLRAVAGLFLVLALTVRAQEQFGLVHGNWSGLNDRALYEGRDLPVLTDFRSVLTDGISQHLGLSAKQTDAIFPGYSRKGAPIKVLKG